MLQRLLLRFFQWGLRQLAVPVTVHPVNPVIMSQYQHFVNEHEEMIRDVYNRTLDFLSADLLLNEPNDPHKNCRELAHVFVASVLTANLARRLIPEGELTEFGLVAAALIRAAHEQVPGESAGPTLLMAEDPTKVN